MGSNNKTLITTTPANIGSPQSVLNRQPFDDAIFAKGYNVYVERALTCPCAVKGSGQALTGCLNCGGSKYFYIDKFKTKLLCSSMANKTKFEVWTKDNMGTVNISARPQDRLGFMDRITILDLESVYTQTLNIKKSKTNIYFSFLTYQPLHVYDVYFFKNETEELIYLEPTTNYTVDNNKIKLVEVPGVNLATFVNPTITVRYTHNPTYYVLDINRDIIKQSDGKDCVTQEDHLANFPQNCIGRRCHFVLDAPNFSGDRLNDNTNYDREKIDYDY